MKPSMLKFVLRPDIMINIAGVLASCAIASAKVFASNQQVDLLLVSILAILTTLSASQLVAGYKTVTDPYWINLSESVKAIKNANIELRNHEVLPTLEAHSKDAADILIIARTGRYIIGQKFKRTNIRLRFAFIDSRSKDAINALKQENNVSGVNQDLAIVEARLAEVQKRLKRFEIRTMKYIPTLSFVKVKRRNAPSTILVELIPNKQPFSERKHFILNSDLDNELYEQFAAIAESIWDSAQKKL